MLEQLGNDGYNAANGEFGILDPTKVTRTPLQNAASIAGLMITIEARVTEARKGGAPACAAALVTPLAYTGSRLFLPSIPPCRLVSTAAPSPRPSRWRLIAAH